MRKFLYAAQQRYRDRYIVLDAPPIGESADASILAEFCDRVVIVVPYGRVTEGQVSAAVDSVDKSKLFGLVMNDEPV
jgi:Mrp family chromosome partitioning ATPase